MVGDVTGYGSWGNPNEVVTMGFLDEEGKKAHVKKLWQEDHKKYMNGRNGVSD